MASKSAQAIEPQEDFSAGFFTGIAGYLIPPNGCARLDNGLLDEKGMIYKRGGATYKSDAAFGASGLTFIWDGFLTPGRRTLFANANDFGVLDSDDESPITLGGDGMIAPKQVAVVAGILFIGGGYMYGGSRKTASYTTSGSNTVVTTDSATVTDATGGFTANVDAGMLMQRGNERVYVVESVDSDTSLTLTEPYEGVTANNINVTFHNIYEIVTADPYPDSEFYVAVAGRLLAADGGTVSFSGVNDPHSYGADDFHEVQEGEQVTGFGSIRQEALIFTDQGMWSLSGLAFNIVSTNGDPQHTLQVISRDLVLWDAVGITGWSQALLVPCTDSLWLVDGENAPMRLSRSIDKTYRTYVRQGYQPGQAAVYQGHLFLPIISPSGNPRDCLVCRLDMPTQDEHGTIFPWVRITGQAGELSGLALRVGTGTSRDPRLLAAERRDTSRILDLNTLFTPGADYKADPDASVPELIVETRTYSTGSGTKNLVQWVRTRYDLLDAGSDDPEIGLAWASDSTPISNAQWDNVTWDNFQWGSGQETFFELDCTLTEGQEMAERCRVRKRRRFIRFRYTNSDPVATLSLKGVEVFTRPSQAVRI